MINSLRLHQGTASHTEANVHLFGLSLRRTDAAAHPDLAQAPAPASPPASPPPPPPGPVLSPVPFVQAPGPPGCRTVEQILAANPNLTDWLANLQVITAPLPQ